MVSRFVSFPAASSWAACLLVLLSLVARPVSAQTGLDSPEPVAAYLDGVFPVATPGDGGQTGYVAVDAFPNLRFDDPLVFTPLAGTDRIFVASRDGYIESFVNDPLSSTKIEMLDLRNTTAVVWDGGMLGLAFHPDFGVSSNHVFIYYCARPPGGSYPSGSTGGFFNTYLRLSRFEIDPVTYVADPASELIMLNLRLYNGSHRGGGLVFGDDGLLYLSIGDQFRYETAQDLEDTLEGGILRLDVDMTPGSSHPPRRVFPTDAGQSDEISGVGYTIPDDNPWLDPAGSIFEEYYTVGNRAPHRMTKDLSTGWLWEAEIGQNKREEVNIIEKGFNYGWPFREGTIEGVRSEPASYYGTLKEPVLDFPRTEARAIIGGYVYRGTEHPELVGRYICGDYSRDNIFAVDYDAQTGTGTREILGTFLPGDLCTFGQDLQGEIYLCGLGQDVPIYKLEKQTLNGPAPALLSQTGAFTDLATLTPAPGVIPYSLNQPFWSDGAEKYRWMAIPNDGTHDTAAEQIAYSEEGDWEFPIGTVLVKHFELPVDDTDPAVTRRLETRFLVRGQGGDFYGVTYRWRPDGTEADVLQNEMDEDILITTATGTRSQTWHYPSRSACLTCHSSEVGYVLGPRTRQLNRDQYYGVTGRTENQLLTLSFLGALDTAVNAPDLPDLLTNVPVTDATASREMRVRSYLDANCSYCHRPETGNRGTFDARLSVPFESQGFLYGTVNDDLGIPGGKVVVPQDLSTSLLYQRMATVIPDVAMPPLAKNREDQIAVQLMENWISMLPVDAPINVAKGKATAQSSTGYNGVPGRAVDGNTDGVYNHGSITHTNTEFQPWWEVDLGDTYDLTDIVLWNRTDCCSSRLSDFHILISDDPFVSPDLATVQAQPGVTDLFHAGQPATQSTHDVDRSGRYVRIQLSGTNPLSLAEVQVFASAWQGPPVTTFALGSAVSGDADHDGWLSNLVIDESATYTNTSGGVERWRVDTFDFHAWQAGDPVTPFVVRADGDNSFTVLAVGTTRNPGEYAVGDNSFGFDHLGPRLLEIQPGETIASGFLDAAADGSGGGVGSVIPYDPSGNEIWYSGGSNAGDAGAVIEGNAPIAGSTTDTGLSRTYHFGIDMTRLEEIAPTPTAVDDDMPSPFGGVVLAQAQPNPFNPSTTLRAYVNRTNHVNWAIYDIRGRLVHQLASGVLPEGEHVRTWKGTDMRGQQVASGVYYQRFAVPGFVQSNKLTLVK